MNILTIVSAGVIFGTIAMILKNIKSPTASLVSGIVLIITAIIPYIITIVKTMRDFAQMSPLGEGFLAPILKITGIAYIAQIGSDLCEQNGEKALSAHIQTAGKIAITVIAIPIAKEAFTRIMGIL